MTKEEQALVRAKIALMTKEDSAFFSTIVFSLNTHFNEELPTVWTDGLSIGINPNFFMSLTQEERVFLLVHEAMHVAYLHMDRLQERNQKKWNIATDYVINHQLISRGFKMPKGCLHNPNYANMTSEEVYKKLKEEKNSSYKEFDYLKAPPKDIQEEVREILIRAAMQSKAANDAVGTIPGDLEIFIESLLKPQLPWQTILQRFLNKVKKTDYTFKSPSKRFFPKYYLPSLKNQASMDLSIAIDTSGSVSDEEFHFFISEVAGILKQINPEKISIIQFDTKIHSVAIVKNIRELEKLKFKGRGGTNIREVIDWANNNKPDVMLVFSDGYFAKPNQKTKVPWVWLIHDNKKFNPEFGKAIYYSMRQTKC